MPTTSRQHPRVGLLLDALYNEYASIVDAACTARDRDFFSAVRDRLLASACGFLAVQEDDLAPLAARHRRPSA